MPLFNRVFGQLEEHIKHGKRARLRHRTMVIIAQDRVDRLAATTGWQPPYEITWQGAKRHG